MVFRGARPCCRLMLAMSLQAMMDRVFHLGRTMGPVALPARPNVPLAGQLRASSPPERRSAKGPLLLRREGVCAKTSASLPIDAARQLQAGADELLTPPLGLAAAIER